MNKRAILLAVVAVMAFTIFFSFHQPEASTRRCTSRFMEIELKSSADASAPVTTCSYTPAYAPNYVTTSTPFTLSASDGGFDEPFSSYAESCPIVTNDIEDFSSYGAGTSIKNTAYWNNWDGTCAVETFESWPTGAFTGSTPSGGGSWAHTTVTATVVTGKYGQLLWSGAGHSDFTFTTHKATAANDYVEFKAYPAQNSVTFYTDILKDTSNYLGIRFTNDGKIYAANGGAWVELQAYSATTWYTVRVTFVTTTTYDVKVDSTTYTNGGAHFGVSTGTIDDIIYFAVYSSGAAAGCTLDNIATSWASSTAYTFTQSNNRGRFVKSTSESTAPSYPLYSWATAGSAAGQQWGFTFYMASLPTTNCIFAPRSSGSAYLETIFIATNGQFQARDNDHYDLVTTLSITTWYSITIIFASATTYDIAINNTLYTNGGSHFTNNGATSGYTGQLYFYFAATPTIVCDFTIDQLWQSWTSEAPTENDATSWNAWDSAGGGNLFQSNGRGLFLKTTTSAWTTYPIYTYPTAQPSAASGSCGFTYRSTSWNTQDDRMFFYDAALTDPPVLLKVTSAGHLVAYDNDAAAYIDMVTLTSATSYDIIITKTDSTHFTVRVGTSTYGPYKTYGASTAKIGAINYKSEDSGTTAYTIDNIWCSWSASYTQVALMGIDEPFEQYGEGNKIRNQGGWDAWTENAGDTFTQSSNKGHFAQTTSDGNNLYPKYSFETSRAAAAGDMIGVTIHVDSLPTAGNYLRVKLGASTGAIYISFDYDGSLYKFTELKTSATIASGLALDVDYTLKIVIVSTSSYDVAINNVLYTNGGSHYTAYTTFTTNLATLEFYSNSGCTCDAYIDSLFTSWCHGTKYYIDSGIKYPYTSAFTLSGQSNGAHDVHYYSIDNAGNIESAGTTSVFLDINAPTTHLHYYPTGTLYNATSPTKIYVSGSTTFKLDAADGGSESGVAATKYKVSGGTTIPWTTYSAPFTLGTSANGTYTISWCSWDNVGNNETLKTQVVYIDATAPLPNAVAYSSIYNASTTKGFILPAATITLSATDGTGESSLLAMGYKIDGIAGTSYHRAWGTYSTPFSIASNGTYRVIWSYWDNVNNNATSSFIIRVDALPATTTIAFTPAFTSGGKSWVSSTTTFTMSTSDNTGGAGVASTWYTIMEIYWFIGALPYTGPIVPGTLTNGTWTLQAWTIDNAGNNETAASVVFNLDAIAPVLADPVYSTIYNVSATQGYISPGHTIGLAGTDGAGESGIAGKGYKIDGIAGTSFHKAWGTYAAPFSIASNGTYRVTWSCWDHVGNNASASFIIFVDGIAPSTNMSFTSTYSSGGKNWVTDATTFTLVASDGAGESGVGDTWFKWDGTGTNPWMQYTIHFMLSMMGNGTYTISWCSWDNAGNNETLNTRVVYIDAIDPVVVASTSTTGVYVECTLAGTDSRGSGVSSILYRINGTSWITYSVPFFLLDNVSWLIEYVAIDNVGNWGTIESITTTIVPNVAAPVNWRLVIVVIAIAVLALFGLVAATRKHQVLEPVQLQVHVQRKRKTKQLFQTAGIGVATGVFTVLVYLLWIAPASEPIIDVVSTSINVQTLSGIDAAQALLSTFTLVVMGVFVFVSGLVMHSKKGLASTVFSLLTTWLAMLAISFVGLMLFAHWQFQITYVFAMPVLFTCYVLANSGYYIAIFVVVLTIALFRFNKQFGVTE